MDVNVNNTEKQRRRKNSNQYYKSGLHLLTWQYTLSVGSVLPHIAVFLQFQLSVYFQDSILSQLLPLTVVYFWLNTHSEGKVPIIVQILSRLLPHKMAVNTNMPKYFCIFPELSFEVLFSHTGHFTSNTSTPLGHSRKF